MTGLLGRIATVMGLTLGKGVRHLIWHVKRPHRAQFHVWANIVNAWVLLLFFLRGNMVYLSLTQGSTVRI